MTTRIKLRRSTLDRAPPDEVKPPETPEIHTVEQIGPNRAYTPNGNLICYDVPIARVGWMLYGPDEVDVKVNDQGYCRVYRGEDELFHAICVGSFMGVAITDEHPEGGDVNPDNWAELAKGFVMDVRRGRGDNADVLLADLIITDRDLIKKILAGKVEVSAGYDASYHDDGGGVGRQYDIVGNHVALVERGRCGPRCAIGDSAYQPPAKETTMPQERVRLNAPQRRVRLARFLDELLEETSDPAMPDGEQPAGSGGDQNGTHIHLHMGGAAPGAANPLDPSLPQPGPTADNLDPSAPPAADPANPSAPLNGDGDIGNRVAALEQGQQAILQQLQQITQMLNPTGDQAPPADPDDADPAESEGGPPDDDTTRDEMPEELEDKEKARTTDSAALATSYSALLADAEILFPGYRAPTFDSAQKRTATVDRMCSIRRKVLDHAYATTDGKTLIDGITGKSTLTLDSMKCTEVATTFRSAVAARKVINNAITAGNGKVPTKTTDNARPKVRTAAEINAANKAFYDEHPIPA